MNKIFTLLLSFLFLTSNAKIESVVLTPEQYTLLMNYKALQNNPASIYANNIKKFAKDNLSLKTIDSAAITNLTATLLLNKDVLYNNDTHHKLCNTIAKNIISSEFYLPYLRIAKEQGVTNDALFNSNMQSYLENEIFKFYYNNNGISYLDKPEYVEVLKPRPVLDLITKQQGSNMLNEIIFIAKNSNYNLYKN